MGPNAGIRGIDRLPTPIYERGRRESPSTVPARGRDPIRPVPSTMLCERCQKAKASVHIDEVKSFVGPGHPDNDVDEHHLCETCAEEANLPHLAVQQKTMDEVWKLLQLSAMKAQKKPARPTPTCRDCGTTLEEVRRKGRLGCQGCYATFAQYLDGLLERMHGSTTHVGRRPGIDADAAERERAIERATRALAEAVESEEFERAAELRDELNELTRFEDGKSPAQ